ncbi:2-dehydro-3-deoxygluconokinase [Falsiruegeria litorea R37]|uniref:2-dehydro-3-deoxygluconokinase n=1 Tax=Falsiruegeria litorea R37 TaxID=1200284 RepID=A0A1Y5SAS5_9RHOB|nr:carbohydrate kinase [Falsiruegeria litorea]SLN35287.1 2-dehydro-3-deoxygluconokinase [Falsiruegeria litorea R37]
MILCCGEALVDMIPDPTRQDGVGFVAHCGGAVMNTAVALSRLGAPTGLFTGLSHDLFGRQLEEHLRASHVDLSFVSWSNRPSTLAFVHFEDGKTSYEFMDENSAGRMLTAADLPNLTEEVSALFFGGISLAVEPAADTYATFLEREKSGRVVMLDPNIRENFIPDQERYRARLERMMAKTDILKVSDEDLDWLIPRSLPLAQKVALLKKLGPSVIIVTRGSAGAVGFLRDGASVSVAAQHVEVVDTVGAGDTFNAGLLRKLMELECLGIHSLRKLNEDHLERALAFASKVASISASRKGADPPWAHEMQGQVGSI